MTNLLRQLYSVRALTACALVVCSSHIASAQAATQVASPSAKQIARARQSADAIQRARTLVAARDTNGAIKILRDATEHDSRNGVLWHEYGVLQAATTSKDWRTSANVMTAGVPDKLIAADSALALAMHFEPDSARYAIDYADLLWRVRWFGGTKSIRLQTRAMSQLQGTTDSTTSAEVADKLGLMLWRNFELLIGRTLAKAELPAAPANDTSPKTKPASGDFLDAKADDVEAPPLLSDPIGRMQEFQTTQGMIKYVKENFPNSTALYSPGQFAQIIRYASTARASMPDSELYFRHEMMMLAQVAQWAEAGDVARKRTVERPKQAWPWLVLGLSEYRRARIASAEAAFDSGFARLPQTDRDRLSSIARMLAPKMARMYDTLSADGQEQFREFYFNSASPSLLMTSNPVRAEFRARVVFSELCFTEDERKRNGADSERGEIFIRYGAPDFNIGTPTTRIWMYVPERLTIYFWTSPFTGSTYLTRTARTVFEQFKFDFPSAYANLAVLQKRIDSVSTQVVRFRAVEDSMDVAVYAGIRPGMLRRDSPIDRSTIQHGVFVVDGLETPITKSIGTFVSNERDTTVMVGESYTLRADARARGVRSEALEPDLQQAARTLNVFPVFETRGFGISDLLIAANVEPSATQPNVRWKDFAITPLTGGIVKRGAPLSLLWESYEPVATSGNVRLRYAVTVQRVTDRGLVAQAARIIGGIRDAVTRNRSSADNQLTVSYDRQAAAAPVLVDYLRIDAGSLEPGLYQVAIAVTDLTSNEQRTRTQRFVVK